MSSEGMRTASANPAATAPSPDPSTTPIRGRRLARSRMNCAACSARRKSSVAEVAIGFDHPAGSDCHPERLLLFCFLAKSDAENRRLIRPRIAQIRKSHKLGAERESAAAESKDPYICKKSILDT